MKLRIFLKSVSLAIAGLSLSFSSAQAQTIRLIDTTIRDPAQTLIDALLGDDSGINIV